MPVNELFNSCNQEAIRGHFTEELNDANKYDTELSDLGFDYSITLVDELNSRKLENLVGYRFKSLKDIEKRLRKMGAENPKVCRSTSDRTDQQDFCLDCSLDKAGGESGDDYKDFSLFYLTDNAGHFYITEVSAWGF